jgi:hypothetical protein
VINELVLIAVVLFAVTCGVAATAGKFLARRGRIFAWLTSGLAAPAAIVVMGGVVTLLTPAALGGAPIVLIGAATLAFLSLPVCLLASWLTLHWLRPRASAQR